MTEHILQSIQVVLGFEFINGRWVFRATELP